jgi:hypothetical protein
VWRSHTGEDAEPDQWRIRKYYWISRIVEDNSPAEDRCP